MTKQERDEILGFLEEAEEKLKKGMVSGDSAEAISLIAKAVKGLALHIYYMPTPD